MNRAITRRGCLGVSASGAALAGCDPGEAAARAEGRASGSPVEVVVWDERQPAQKQAYDNFLANQIAGYLKTQPGMSVRSVGLDDPGHETFPVFKEPVPLKILANAVRWLA